MTRKKFLNLAAKTFFSLGLSMHLSCHSKSGFTFAKNQTLAFIGDSITFQGGYIKYLENHLNHSHPSLNLNFRNLGLNSETVSGLSEPVHHPPRPLLFDRLDEILNTAKPDFVFFLYGINDGIYHPFSSENFIHYKNGVAVFLEKMKALDLPVILLSPTPFVLSGEKKEALLKSKNTNYSWKNPYPNYDEEVIKKYRDHIMSIRHVSVKANIDIYTPLRNKTAIAFGEDPIHPTNQGHQIIGETIIQSLQSY